MKINTEIWGPYFWFFLHTISLNYPRSPTETLKKKYYDLITNFYLFIPDVEVGNTFNQLLDQYPVSPFLDSRKSFIHWVHFIHNKINENIGKPKISLSTFYSNYYELTKPKIEKEYYYNKWSNKVIFLLFLLCLIGFVTYLYRI
jgi:hypothetical protein